MLRVPLDAPITLRFGAATHTVHLSATPSSSILQMNVMLAAKLGLAEAHGCTLLARFEDETLRLGPLVAVLLPRASEAKADRAQPFGSHSAFARECVDAAQKLGGFVTFVTPELLAAAKPTQSSLLTAWVHSAKQGWHITSVPIADVMHNRLTTRKAERNSSVQQFIGDVNLRYGGHFYNRHLLDKSVVFDALRKNSELRCWLPVTESWKSRAQLAEMVRQFGTVFVKPVMGSLGKGIMRVTRSTDPGKIRKLALNKSRYQLQQGIELATIDGRPVDFRAVMQKNERGEWALTSIVARQAAPGQIVSNLARGGTLIPIKMALARSNVLAAKKSQVHVQLTRAALSIARALDESLAKSGLFGEFGVDLAVEPSGKVWLLEVNSKPSKLDHTPLPHMKIRPSVLTFLKYCRYLSGYQAR